MKKILLILMVALMVLSSSISILVPNKGYASEIHGDVNISYIPQAGLNAYVSLNYDLLKNCNIYAGIDVLFDVKDHNPPQDAYNIGTVVNIYKGLYVELGHTWTRSVWSYKEQVYDIPPFIEFKLHNKLVLEFGSRTDIRVGYKW